MKSAWFFLYWTWNKSEIFCASSHEFKSLIYAHYSGKGGRIDSRWCECISTVLRTPVLLRYIAYMLCCLVKYSNQPKETRNGEQSIDRPSNTWDQTVLFSLLDVWPWRKLSSRWSYRPNVDFLRYWETPSSCWNKGPNWRTKPLDKYYSIYSLSVHVVEFPECVHLMVV